MRKKNIILLTSITGLLLTLTPSQSLAQESVSSTITNQSSSDKNTDDKDDDRKLPTDDKCHWKGETPVPENKYLKMLYDAAYKGYDYEEELEKIKNDEYLPKELKQLVDNGEISKNEAKYRALLLHDREYKDRFSYYLRQYLEVPLDPGWVKEIVKDAYDNPENIDDIVKEMIDSYSLKDHLEYVDKFVQPDIHVSYSSKELHDKYQKEFDELDKVIEYDKNKKKLMEFI